MTVTLPWAPWNGQKPLRRTKHGTATEVGGIFSQITHRSAGWRDTVVGSIADSMRGQTFGRIAKSCDKAERELACPGEVFLGTSSRNEAVAWQVQSGLSWSGWARRRRAFVRSTTMACASSSRSCCDVRDPCDAGRGLQCDPERQHLRSCSRTLLISS